MNSKKFTTVFILAIISVFILSVCLFCLQTAYAEPLGEDGVEITTEDGVNESTPPETDTGEELPDVGSDTVSDSVKEYLKSIYGEDYERYYNQIIENWGSIEKFLLSASENLPESYKYRVQELLLKVAPYVAIAADTIMLLAAGFYIFYRAKKNKKVNTDLEKVKAALNQTGTAELAIIESLQAQSQSLKRLLPGERFAAETAALTESEETLKKATEEVKRNV